jgi:hypothetical protein
VWRFGLAVITLLLPSVARAEPAPETRVDGEAACGSRSAWVRVEVTGLAPAFEAAVLAQLRAGLRGERLEACWAGAPGARAPSAVLALRPDAGGAVRIEVRDPHRTLRRRVELRRVPRDGRALALAVAADELIRAALADDPILQPAPEPAVREPPPAALARTAPRARPRRTALGVRFASERYGGGQRTLGIDIAARHVLAGRLYARAALGARKLESVRALHGEITGTLLGGELGAGVALLRVQPLSVSAELGLWAGRAAVEGEAAGAARGSHEAAWFAVGRAGAALEVRAAPWLGLELRGGAGATLRRVHVEDTGVTQTAISGVEAYGSFGPNLVF